MQETTERDLWAFDDALDSPNAPEDVWVELPPARAYGKDIPMPRERQPGKKLGTTDNPESDNAASEDQIRINVNKPPIRNRPAGSLARPSTPESTFDDLESWDQLPVKPEIVEPPAEVVAAPTQPEYQLEPEVAVVALAEITPDSDTTETKDEFSPVVRANAVPVSLRLHWRFSKTEWAGLVGLLVLLLATGGAILGFSLRHLPTETHRVQTNDFPIKGDYLTVDSATSYWRAPVTAGDSPDTFRHGTRLLPVLELTANGGPAVIRVLFRNEERAVVGDVVSRAVRDHGKWIIPATAGFDDFGMHAAYRTGEGKRWTIEVFEAPAESAAGKEFQKLFAMDISTDLR
ncbi:MAG: hypothetical protein NTV46_07495 [Verrucomicrobia bacterium]|nr:hypothetical protein [Verrucomicrobiota bacterium]